MALIFSDGFDAYGTSGTSSGMISKGWCLERDIYAGRTDGYSMCPTASQHTYCTIGNNDATKTMGFALQLTNSSAWDHFYLYLGDGPNSPHIKVFLNSSQKLDFYLGSTLKQSGTTTLSLNTWYYIEIKSTIDNSNGSYELKIDGITEYSDSGIDTKYLGDANWNRLDFYVSSGPASGDILVDDLYVTDSSGSVNTGFLGDTHIETLFPNSDAGTNQWTTSTGTDHYALVDDNPMDDSSYLEDDTSGNRELFDMDSLTGSGSIVATVSNVTYAVTDAEVINIKPVIKSGTTTTTGSSSVIASTDWSKQVEIYEEDPDTTSAWTKTAVNAAQFGFEVS